MKDKERIIELETTVGELRKENTNMRSIIRSYQTNICNICKKDFTGVKGLIGSTTFLCFKCRDYAINKTEGIGSMELQLPNKV